MYNVGKTYEIMLAEALLLDRQGRIPEAIAAYERLLQSWPGLPDCWYNLGVLYRKVHEFEKALGAYSEALERGVRQAEEVHLNRGVILSDALHRPAEAERELQRALKLNPDYLPALVNYANLHEDLGRREQAAALYERILSIAPDSPQVLARYAGLIDFDSAQHPMIARLRDALAATKLTLADRASLEFALGRALDASAQYDAAFDTYRAANRHSRESVPGAGYYDLLHAEQYVDRLIAAFPVGRQVSVPPPVAQRQPVFICGMFRSGSTLVEQLLAGHPRIAAAGEFDFLPRAVANELAPFPESLSVPGAHDLQDLARRYLATLGTAFPGAGWVTDKRPDNFLYLGLIKRLFPTAKIVHTMRDVLDNCLSVYFLHLDQSQSYALDLMDIAHYYRQYQRLMRHWKASFGEDIIDIAYDQLVLDAQGQLEPVLGALGLPWHERCLEVPAQGSAVRTASVWQVRKPLYQSSSGRARHYLHRMAEVRKYFAHPL